MISHGKYKNRAFFRGENEMQFVKFPRCAVLRQFALIPDAAELRAVILVGRSSSQAITTQFSHIQVSIQITAIIEVSNNLHFSFVCGAKIKK